MNNVSLSWIVAALVLGAVGIYAVFSADDSIAQTKPQTVFAAQDRGRYSSSPPAAPAPALSSRTQEAVSINPFGK
jgi:hypothetical protein